MDLSHILIDHKTKIEKNSVMDSLNNITDNPNNQLTSNELVSNLLLNHEENFAKYFSNLNSQERIYFAKYFSNLNSQERIFSTDNLDQIKTFPNNKNQNIPYQYNSIINQSKSNCPINSIINYRTQYIDQKKEYALNRCLSNKDSLFKSILFKL